jgi:hypothetical protein
MSYTIKKVIIMAIFYKHIKGCGGNSIGAPSENNQTDLWA